MALDSEILGRKSRTDQLVYLGSIVFVEMHPYIKNWDCSVLKFFLCCYMWVAYGKWNHVTQKSEPSSTLVCNISSLVSKEEFGRRRGRLPVDKFIKRRQWHWTGHSLNRKTAIPFLALPFSGILYSKIADEWAAPDMHGGVMQASWKKLEDTEMHSSDSRPKTQTKPTKRKGIQASGGWVTMVRITMRIWLTIHGLHCR